MTEETIRAIIETDHFDSTKIKKLLEQHEAEMAEAMNWISEEGWVKYKGVDRWKNEETIPLPFKGMSTKKYKLPPQTTTDLLTLFKNRNK